MNKWKYEKYESPKNGFGEYFITHNYTLENEKGKITFSTDKENYFFLLKFKPFLNEFKSKRDFKYQIDDKIRVKFGENKPINYVVSCLYNRENGELVFKNEVQVSESFDFVKNMLSNDKFVIEYNSNDYITFEPDGFLDNDNPVLNVYRKKHLPNIKTKNGIKDVIGTLIGLLLIFGGLLSAWNLLCRL
jgi:hypothetical protein